MKDSGSHFQAILCPQLEEVLNPTNTFIPMQGFAAGLGGGCGASRGIKEV